MLHGNDALFRTLFAAAVDGIVVSDASGKVANHNDACERLFGCPAGEAACRDYASPSPARAAFCARVPSVTQTEASR
ncbi:MAG: PAS domain-containing protein [Rhizomicrobium sp.]